MKKLKSLNQIKEGKKRKKTEDQDVKLELNSRLKIKKKAKKTKSRKRYPNLQRKLIMSMEEMFST